MTASLSPELKHVEEEPDDGVYADAPLQLEAATWGVWDHLSPASEAQARQELAAGIEAFTQAERDEQKAELSPKVLEKYQQASRNLVNFRAITIDEDRKLDVADAVTLTMLGTAQAKQAQAGEAKPYQGSDYQATGRFAGISRRAVLSELAHRNLKLAQEIFTANGNYEASANVFDVEDPVQAVAKAAVKARLSLDTTKPKISDKIVQEETAELLQTQGEKGIERLIDRKENDPRFMALYGKNILKGMVESPAVISRG